MVSFSAEALVTRYGPDWTSPLWDVDYANIGKGQNMQAFLDSSYKMVGQIPAVTEGAQYATSLINQAKAEVPQYLLSAIATGLDNIPLPSFNIDLDLDMSNVDVGGIYSAVSAAAEGDWETAAWAVGGVVVTGLQAVPIAGQVVGGLYGLALFLRNMLNAPPRKPTVWFYDYAEKAALMAGTEVYASRPIVEDPASWVAEDRAMTRIIQTKVKDGDLTSVFGCAPEELPPVDFFFEQNDKTYQSVKGAPSGKDMKFFNYGGLDQETIVRTLYRAVGNRTNPDNGKKASFYDLGADMEYPAFSSEYLGWVPGSGVRVWDGLFSLRPLSPFDVPPSVMSKYSKTAGEVSVADISTAQGFMRTMKPRSASRTPTAAALVRGLWEKILALGPECMMVNCDIIEELVDVRPFIPPRRDLPMKLGLEIPWEVGSIENFDLAYALTQEKWSPPFKYHSTNPAKTHDYWIYSFLGENIYRAMFSLPSFYDVDFQENEEALKAPMTRLRGRGSDGLPVSVEEVEGHGGPMTLSAIYKLRCSAIRKAQLAFLRSTGIALLPDNWGGPHRSEYLEGYFKSSVEVIARSRILRREVEKVGVRNSYLREKIKATPEPDTDVPNYSSPLGTVVEPRRQGAYWFFIDDGSGEYEVMARRPKPRSSTRLLGPRLETPVAGTSRTDLSALPFLLGGVAAVGGLGYYLNRKSKG